MTVVNIAVEQLERSAGDASFDLRQNNDFRQHRV
jgi:hypothetical protein